MNWIRNKPDVPIADGLEDCALVTGFKGAWFRSRIGLNCAPEVSRASRSVTANTMHLWRQDNQNFTGV